MNSEEKPALKNYTEDFYLHFRENVQEAFRALLSEKHLYQSVMVDDAFISGVTTAILKAILKKKTNAFGSGGSVSIPEQTVRQPGAKMLMDLWLPDGPAPESWGIPKSLGHVLDSQTFLLPTIRTTCPRCGGLWPFNPVGSHEDRAQGSTSNQWFLLNYQCQDCKTEPIRFLVTRSGRKLTLTGRSPMEKVSVPAVVPKKHADHYSGAIIAHQAGQTLAGLFLLRVLIEQYWRGIPAIKAATEKTARPSGDELGTAYKALLPDDFKERFPNLAETYGKLSEALHAAREDGELFAVSCATICEHFDALRLFKLALG